MRNMPWRGEALTRSLAGGLHHHHCAPTSIALMGSRHNEADRLTDFCKRCRKEQNTTTGCSATTTTTEPLMKSTSCCGSRSCESSEAGQSREKHGDTAVPFSALSVDQARRAGKEESP